MIQSGVSGGLNHSACLMTATTPDYVAGTLVMIASFLKHNAWFVGDIKIIATDLGVEDVAELKNLSPHVSIVAPSAALKQALDAAIMPQAAPVKRHARFTSLDAFQASDYDHVIYCDSDLLFCGSIEDVLEQADDLAAGPDGAALRGATRTVAAFKEVPVDHPAQTLGRTFNSGLMIVGKSLRSGAHFKKMLEMVQSEYWTKIKNGHSDQAVLNTVLAEFEPSLTVADNFLFAHEAACTAALGGQDIRVFHFNGAKKPWHVSQVDIGGMDAGVEKTAFQDWHNVYRVSFQNRPIDASGPRKQTRFYGAKQDLSAVVKTHLFLLCPNNSGSTYLSKVVGGSQNVWSLLREGQHVFGFAGPNTNETHALVWAGTDSKLRDLSDQSLFDWDKTTKAWYFQAFAQRADAPIFFTKAPPFLSYPEAMRSHFSNTKFLMMVRNPYSVVESIVRRYARREPDKAKRVALASAHIVRCFELQRENQARYAETGLFFTYEEMCAEPKRISSMIVNFVPELDDLNLGRRIPIKGLYDEPLRNMNADQISRLSSQDIDQINQTFSQSEEVIQHFGYSLI